MSETTDPVEAAAQALFEALELRVNVSRDYEPYLHDDALDEIRAAIRAAVEAEREATAQWLEANCNSNRWSHGSALSIADAIRARSQKEPKV